MVSQREREKWRDVYVTVKGRQTDKQADKAAHDVTCQTAQDLFVLGN